MEQDQVFKLIAEHLGVEVEKIKLDSDFEKDLDADSLDTADLFLAVKEEFGVRMKEEEIIKIKTVRNLIDMLDKHSKKKGRKKTAKKTTKKVTKKDK
ncbi:MAG: acyl carrier protein [Coxiellaceae bacterium]|nr:acyl carrier protein [Coxiellaceae bacterium]